jgi:hypothetical protein
MNGVQSTSALMTGKTETLWRRTCSSDPLSTTNPTKIGLGSNSDSRGEKTATNHLSHGTAPYNYYLFEMS